MKVVSFIRIALAKLQATGISFLNVYLITNIYGLELYGEYAFFQAMVTLLSFFALVGSNITVIKKTALERSASAQLHYVKKSFTIIFIASISLSIPAIWISKMPLPMVIGAMISVVFLGITQNIGNYYRGLDEDKYYNLTVNLPPIVFLVSIISENTLKLNTKPSVLYFFSVVVTGALMYVVIHLTNSDRRFNSIIPFARISIEDIYRGVPMMLSGGLGKYIQMTPVLFLGNMNMLVESGIYSIAQRLSSLINMFLVAAGAAVSRTIAKDDVANYKRNLRAAYLLATKISFGSALSMCILYAVFGQWIISLFGVTSKDGFLVLFILSVSQLVIGLSGPSGVYMNLTRRNKEFMFIMAGSATTMTIVSLFGFYSIGLVGLAIGSLAGVFYWKLLSTLVVLKDLWRLN